MKLDMFQESAVTSPHDRVLVVAGAGAGKCQPNTTVIPTPIGYKTIGDIKIGDLVFNKNGEPETVIGVFPQGRKEVYRITLADGRYSDCCEEHLWSYDNGHNGLTTNTTKQMYDRGWVTKDKRNHNKYKYFIPNLTKPVEYKMNIEYSVNPYVLGCFIGDGCCLENALTISSSDEFIVKTIAEICDFEYKKLHPENYSWSFKKDGKPIQTKNFFNNFKKEIICCCGEKRIPSEYFIGSISQRLELLRGLMDTDGYVGDGRHSPTYSTTSYGLAQDVAELSRSLGFFTSVLKYTRNSKKSTEYTVTIYTGAKQVQNIFKLPRKIEAAKKFENHENRMKRNFVSIRNIEKLDKNEEMSCILVDHPEHLYLTNNFIVTHNTACLIGRINFLLEQGYPSEQIAAITFTNLAAQEMRSRLPASFKGYIGTIHSLASRFLEEAQVPSSKWYNEKNKFNELIRLGTEYAADKYGCVLVDELQDVSKLEFRFILAIEAEKYFLVGDDWQGLYKFKGADPTIFLKLIKNDRWHKVYLLYNYRSNTKICNFGFNVISNVKKKVDKHMTVFKENEGVVYVGNFSQAVGILEKNKNYKDWLIVARLNDEVDHIKHLLDSKGIPCIGFKKSQLDNEQLSTFMNSDIVKVLTVHSAKGLESKNVIVFNANRNVSDDELKVSYVAATRAKENLYWCTKVIRGKDQFSETYLNTRG